MQLPLFKELFEYLDKGLTDSCDDTLRVTKQFAEERAVQFQPLQKWLGEHGGYCDCEVLANVEEQFERLRQ